MKVSFDVISFSDACNWFHNLGAAAVNDLSANVLFLVNLTFRSHLCAVDDDLRPAQFGLCISSSFWGSLVPVYGYIAELD